MSEPKGTLDTSVNGPETRLVCSMGTPGSRWTGGCMRSGYGGCGAGSSRRYGTGTWQSPEPAETHAAELVEHADRCAAGDAAQRGPCDRGDRWAGRVDRPGPGRGGGAGARHPQLVAARGGQTGVYPESP